MYHTGSFIGVHTTLNPLRYYDIFMRTGDRLGLCPALWHRDADLYPQPLVFNPDRWMLVNNSIGSNGNKFGYLRDVIYILFAIDKNTHVL